MLGDNRYCVAMHELIKNGDIVIETVYKSTVVVKKNNNFKKQTNLKE
jgi:hypothetical protein